MGNRSWWVGVCCVLMAFSVYGRGKPGRKPKCAVALEEPLSQDVIDYMQSAAISPLLNREQERELRTSYLKARAILYPLKSSQTVATEDETAEETWTRDIKTMFEAAGNGKIVGRDRPLGPKQTVTVRQGLEARERMILSNMLLVINIAKAYRGMGADYEDLIAEGNIGLIRAVDNYDLDYGTRFSTFATNWIKNAVRSALSTKGRTIRLPNNMGQLVHKFHQAKTDLEMRIGRKPTFEDVCVEMKIPLKRRATLMDALRGQTFTLTGRSQEDVDDPEADTFEPEDYRGIPPELEADFRAEIQMVTDALEALKGKGDAEARLAEVIRMRYFEGLTLQEAGEILGITKERVRQLEHQGHQILMKLMQKAA